jgi:hypothetical protein
LLCSLRHTLPSSSTISFSLLWRGVSLLYKTRTTLGRMLKRSSDHQGKPRIKSGLWLALVGALELLSATDWNILIFLPNRADHQGKPRIKSGLWLALVGALELLSAADWNILIFLPKSRSRVFGIRH